MKKLFALLLAVVMTLSLAACGEKEEVAAASKLDQIKAAGKLVLGTSADYPPCEFHTEIDGKDTIVGYDISLAQYIADDLGVELEVVDMAFDGLCISLSKGDFDMVISGMSNTPERAQAVDFSEPYFLSEQIILVRAEDEAEYVTVDDLAGKTIAYQSGTIQEGILKELGYLDNAIALTNAQNVVMELKEGKVDVAYLDYMPTLAFASVNEDLASKDIGIPMDSDGQCIAVQKGNEEFVEYLNGIVAEVLENGKMDEFIAEAQLLAGVE